MAVFALVDGNSFYASCEAAFRPELWTRPVVVLSNNDGCIVAANQLAKQLNAEILNHNQGSMGKGGYQAATRTSMMFQPYFKVKDVLAKYQTAVFSSNYELYADMSNRMHTIIGQFAPRQEIYSIDESFIDLTGINQLTDLTELAQDIKATVYQYIGIPVAVGIGASKTQAKLANHLAKKVEGYEGVLDLTALSDSTLNHLYSKVDISNIWGIGRQYTKRLKADGFNTALDLKQASITAIRKKYGVVMEKTVRELNGQACYQLEENPVPKKQIVSSRSFGKKVTSYKELEQAVVTYTARAGEKLRKQNSVCSVLSVYIRSNPHDKKEPYYANGQSVGLVYPTDNTILLAKHARRLLKHIYRPGVNYQKAGITLSEIAFKGPCQLDVFAPNPHYAPSDKFDALMKALDSVNQKEGRDCVFLGSSGIKSKTDWQMKRDLMSKRFTTRWSELLAVKC
ncbi:Y-family DNA polymerase [Hydrogenovibrio kuenenii]|uniref:Y-family DNA polymerase n=1 Tax=Hydrogenovibrio kuenenii TaxID=63658 RepID=UPI0004667E50|nr:Y-family DNA polymerase [Hydrogenovibrio kuenenii]